MTTEAAAARATLLRQELARFHRDCYATDGNPSPSSFSARLLLGMLVSGLTWILVVICQHGICPSTNASSKYCRAYAVSPRLGCLHLYPC